MGVESRAWHVSRKQEGLKGQGLPSSSTGAGREATGEQGPVGGLQGQGAAQELRGAGRAATGEQGPMGGLQGPAQELWRSSQSSYR